MNAFDKAKNRLIERIALELPEDFTYKLEKVPSFTGFTGWKISFDWCDGDFVCHSGSYGGNQGYWESYRFPEDGGDVTGWMNADAVIARMKKHWENRDKKEEEDAQ